MVKAAEYNNGEIRFLSSDKSIKSLLNEINKYADHNFDEILITAHKQWRDEFGELDWLADKRIFLNDFSIPKNFLNYDTPYSLGLDRFLACLGGLPNLHEDDNGIIVVDAGTACTIDMMSREGIFNGGIIMPGLSTWENSLRQFTPQLPEVERELPENYPGKTTKTCLQWGLVGSFVVAIEYHLKQMQQKFGICRTIITGGDGEDLIDPLQLQKNSYEDLLVFRGMVEFRKRFIEESFH